MWNFDSVSNSQDISNDLYESYENDVSANNFDYQLNIFQRNKNDSDNYENSSKLSSRTISNISPERNDVEDPLSQEKRKATR